MDEMEREKVRLWNSLVVSRVKSLLPRFANDVGPHVNNKQR